MSRHVLSSEPMRIKPRVLAKGHHEKSPSPLKSLDSGKWAWGAGRCWEQPQSCLKGQVCFLGGTHGGPKNGQAKPDAEPQNPVGNSP